MNPMRHVLGVLGVLAAGVLLAVSCAMNWQFGNSLGRTEFDGQLLGAASAAADCMKALIPFFFFAAIRNRMWSQALASAVVWVVVTGYSLTSALGYAALTRSDVNSGRVQHAQVYQDLRSELKRAEEQSAWIPQHRPYEAVRSAIEGQKAKPQWKSSNRCADASSKSEQKFCQDYHALNAELASASGAAAADTRIIDIKAKIASMDGASASTEADPQAKVLADLAAFVLPQVKTENMQTAMAVFVALLLEIGSGFGMYVAFSQWRLYDVKAPAAPVREAAVTSIATAAMATPARTPAAEVVLPSSGANDNRTIELPLEPAFEAPANKSDDIVVGEARATVPATARVPLSDGEKFATYMLDEKEGAEFSLHDGYSAYESVNKSRNRPSVSKRRFQQELEQSGLKIMTGRQGQKVIKNFVLNRAVREAMKPPTHAKHAA